MIDDKREMAGLFQTRLAMLMHRTGANQSEFARTIGVDRSALSQLLAGQAVRLPRAETLVRIAATQNVSLDWLLGISQDEGVAASISNALALEEATGGADEPLVAQWHQEAIGTKIRYVPTTIPDFLRTDAVIEYERRETKRALDSQIREAQDRLDYSRRPETDMEVCMPFQRLVDLRDGTGIWTELPVKARHDQLKRIGALIDDLYPSFRLFLYDGKSNFSAPYTVFGPYRAAVYIGDLYLVMNQKEAVSAMTRHFDQLIRAAVVQPHAAAAYMRGLII